MSNAKSAETMGVPGRVCSVAKHAIKRPAGELLFRLCEQFPCLKKSMKGLGFRLDQRLGRGPVRAQLPDGRSIRLTHVTENYLSLHLFWLGTIHYEPITAAALELLLRPRDMFIDVGANIGFYSLLVARTISSVEIIAFEPNPKVHAILQENVGANGFHQITCVPAALSDAQGAAPLYLSDSDLSASLQSDFDYNNSAPVQVPTTTLDAYMAERIGGKKVEGNMLIKVDIEGHEAAFFRGAEETIHRWRPDIIAEVAIIYRHNPFEAFRRCGYRFYGISRNGLEETDNPVPIIQGQLFFPNYLITLRPPEEIERIHQHVLSRVRTIDLMQTSNFFGPDVFPAPRVEK